MIPGRYGLLGPANSSGGDESEALQADVMRFTAILGLCLMVIFALVQSLPTSGETRETSREREEQIAAIESERDEIEEQAARLAARLQSTQSDLDALAQALDVERALRVEQQALQTAQAEIESSLAVEARQELTSLQEELLKSEAEKRDAQRKISILEQQLAVLQTVPEVEQPTETPVSEDSAVITEVVEGSIENTEIQSEQPATTEAPVEAEQGFSLRFSSNDALYAQVLANTVSVYARSDGQLWQLERNGRAMRRAPQSGSLQINEMSVRSIPSRLIGLLKDAGGQTGDVIWGVVLSPVMLEQIERLMKAEGGGVLSIQTDGQVVVE